MYKKNILTNKNIAAVTINCLMKFLPNLSLHILFFIFSNPYINKLTLNHKIPPSAFVATTTKFALFFLVK